MFKVKEALQLFSLKTWKEVIIIKEVIGFKGPLLHGMAVGIWWYKETHFGNFAGGKVVYLVGPGS